MASYFRRSAIAATALSMLVISACSSDTGTTDSGTTGAGETSAAADDGDGRGPITYVEGQDTSENQHIQKIIELWNQQHPDEQVTFQEQPNDADTVHDNYVQQLQAGQSDYDVLGLDVIWTAEFAANDWIVPLEGEYAVDNTGIIPATVESATYNGTQYAAPKNTNGGLLFYRTDLVPTPPSTWSELLDSCPIAAEKNINCYVGQFAQYEGLTVNASEFINANGGSFVEADGTTPAVDTPGTRAGLEQIQQAFDSGVIPQVATTFKETESQQAFQDGGAMYLRNWPYVYGTAAEEGSQVIGNYGVAPLPGPTGPGASTLGGYNLAISAFSNNKLTAHDFIQFVQSPDAQRIVAEGAFPPVRADLYSDPALVAEYPYLPTLLTSIENAVPRPVTPFYPAVSAVIQENVAGVISGSKTIDDAITDMQAGIESAGSR